VFTKNTIKEKMMDRHNFEIISWDLSLVAITTIHKRTLRQNRLTDNRNPKAPDDIYVIMFITTTFSLLAINFFIYLPYGYCSNGYCSEWKYLFCSFV